jgi:hypothetical protein
MIYTRTVYLNGKKYEWQIHLKTVEIQMFILGISISIPYSITKETWEHIEERRLAAEAALKKAFKLLEKKKKKSA